MQVSCDVLLRSIARFTAAEVQDVLSTVTTQQSVLLTKQEKRNSSSNLLKVEKKGKDWGIGWKSPWLTWKETPASLVSVWHFQYNQTLVLQPCGSQLHTAWVLTVLTPNFDGGFGTLKIVRTALLMTL
jgi:hypothetical protein